MLRSWWRRFLNRPARVSRPVGLQPPVPLETRVVPTVLLGLVDGGKTASITLDNAADVATIQLAGATLKVPGAKDLADPTMSNESVSTAKLENIVISGTTGTVNLNGSFTLDGTLSVTGTIQAFDLQADQSFKQGISITIAGSYSVDNALKTSSGDIVLDSGATLTMAANVTASGAVGLSGGIGINQTGGVITAPNLGARSAAGAIALNQANAVDTFAASTVNKSVSVTSANALTIGAVTGVAGFTDTTGIVTGTGSATVTADSLTVSKALNVTTGTVTFAPRTLTEVDLGKADSGSALGIDATDLSSVTAGGVRISAGSGKINLAAALTVTPRLELDAGAGGVSGAGALTADNVLIITAGAADLSAGHAVKTIAISAGGKVTVNSTQPLTVGTVTVVGTFDGINSAGNDVTLKSTGAVAVSKALNSGAGVTRVTAAGAVTQTATGVVTAAGLGVVTSSGSITLDQANVVDVFIGAAQSGKDLRFTSTADLAVNTVGSDGALFTDPGTIATGGGAATIVGKSVAAKVAIDVGSGTLRLRATNGGISQTAAFAATTLGASATGSVDLSLATNAAGTVAVEAGAGQTAKLRVAGAVAVGSVAADGGFPLTTGLTSVGGTVTLRAGGAITLGAASNVGAAGTLGLEAAGDVTQSAGATITAGTLGVNATGVITLNLANALTSVAAVTSAAKAVTLVSTTDATVGSLAATGVFLGATGVSAANGLITITTAGNKLTVSQAVTSGGANVTLAAKTFVISATVSALAGCVTILPGAGNAITIGDGGELTNAELALITAGVLQIGDFANSDVTVVGLASLGANVPTLDLRAGGDLKTTAGADLTVAKLALQTSAAAKVVDFTLGKSDATTLAIDAAGAASYADAGDVTIAAVAVCDGTENGAKAGAGTLGLAAAGKLTLDAEVSRAGGAIRLSGGTGFEQTGGKLLSSTLELLGAGGTLTSTANNVATIAANVTGNVSYTDADAVAIGTAGGTSNITATGKLVRLDVGGALTGGAGTHVTAGQLAIKAATGVGPLNVAVGSVEAKTTTGDIQLTNAATLTIGGVAADLAGLQAPAGGVTVTVSTGTLQVTTEGVNAFGEASLRADAMSITQGVTAKCVSLQQVTLAHKIDVGGADAAGTLGLTDAELDQLSTTQGVRIGQAGGGAIVVSAKVDVAGPLELASGVSITNSAGGRLVVGELALRAGGVVTLTGDNQVTKLAGKSGGDFTFRSVTVLNVGTVTVCGVSLSGIDAAGQKIIISADPTFDQTVVGDCVILTPVNAGGALDIGTQITDTTLNKIKAAVLQIGDATTGAITVSAPVSVSAANLPAIHLWTNTTVTTLGTGAIGVSQLAVTANNAAADPAAVVLSGNNAVAKLAVSAQGDVTFANKANAALALATVPVCGGTLTNVTGNGGSVTLIADEMDLAAQVNGGTKTVLLAPKSAATGIVLGANPGTAGTLELSDGELDNVTAGVLQIGTTSTGAITISGAVDLKTGQVVAAVPTLDLRSSGTIGQSAAVSVSRLGVSSGAAATLNATNDVTTVAGTAAGDFAFTAKAIEVGQVVVADATRSGVVSTGSGTITLTSDTIELLNVVDAGTGCAVLQPQTAGTLISLGAELGGVSLTDAELNQVRAGALRVGSAASGDINLAGAVDLKAGQVLGSPVPTLELRTGGKVSGAGTLQVAQLGVIAAGAVGLGNGNDVGTVAVQAGDDITIRDVNTLTIGQVTLCDGTKLNGIQAAGFDVSVRADAPTITQAVTGDCVVLTTATPGAKVDLGVDLTDAELDLITAGVLQIGDATGGPIVVSAGITLDSGKVPTLHLWTAGDVSATAGGTLAVKSLAVSAGGPVALANDNGVTNLAVAANGKVTFSQAANQRLTVDSVTVCGGAVVDGVVSTNSAIRLTADEMTLNKQVNAGGATVLLAPRQAATAIVLGANPGTAGTLELSDGELDNVTASVLQIGTTATGGIAVDGAIDLTNGQLAGAVPTLDLRSSGSIVGGSPITVQNLGLDAVSGSVNLSASNLVNTLAGSAKSDFQFASGQAFKVDTVATIDVVRSGVTAKEGVVALTSANTIDLFTSVAAATTVTFNTAAGGVGQNAGTVTAKTLELLGTGTFYLDQAANAFGTFAAKVAGLTVVQTTGTLTIGDTAATKGVTLTLGDLFIRTGAGFIFNGDSTSIDLGAGSGEVRSGLADDGAGKASAYPIEITSVAKDGTNRLTASAVNGFAIFGGTNSNVFNVTPSINTPLFVRGGPPTRADVQANPDTVPGDTLKTPSVKGASVGLFNVMPATGSGVFTFTDPNNGAIEVRRPIVFDNIENIRGLSIQASAVQTGANAYQILANGTLNGQPVVGGFSGVLPPLPPFLAAPAFTDPTVPFRAPTVSIGDVDGNGFPDVIVGAGPNSGGPLVTVIRGERVFNSDLPPGSALSSSDIIATFFAYNPEFQGGVSVASVDFNADGFAEIVTGAGPGGGPEVRVFQFLKNQPPQSNIAPLTRFFAYEPNFLGGVRVSVGDVTGDATGPGDTKPDIVTAPGMGRTATVRVYDGNNLFPQFPDGTRTPFRQFDPYDGFRGGAFVDVGRYRDPNGKYADIVTGAGFGGGAHVIVFNGEKLATTNTVEQVIQFFNDGPNDPRSPDPLAALASGVGSVGFGFADTDDRLDIFVGSGLNRRTRVRVYLNNNGLANVSNGKILDYLNLAGKSPGPFDQRLDGANVAVSADNYRP